MEELKNEIYDKNNGFWYKRDGDYYFPEYYLGKGLSLEEATRLKGQRVKEDTENNTECCENGDNYAGILGNKIDGIAIKSTKGTARYRVHVINGSWLPWVNGYDVGDSINGYAGNLGQVIDGVQVEIV